MVCVEPSGVITTYDKRHTFTLAGEHKIHTSGTKKVMFNFKGGRIWPPYMLRFTPFLFGAKKVGKIPTF